MPEAPAQPPGALAPLSPRQREIAQLVAEGRSNAAIALELVLSERTVEHHVTAILQKLDLKSRAELIATVVRDTLVTGSGPVPERAPSNNLPLALTSFVGRETELTEIAGLLDEHRLVTLTGSGGVGKTRAALQIGAMLRDRLSDGVWFAELAALSNATLVTAAIAQALGVQETPNRPLLDTLIAYLKKKTLLLIVDNCEHVIAEARAVATAIARGSPEVRILATSRERLNVAGEHVYRLSSLTVPPPGQTLDAEATGRYAAVGLFADRAFAADARFALTDENAPIIAEICRRLDGIPLAIELAAARIKVLAPRQLAQKLDERFRLLTGGDRSALSRHQTMRALIDWSYDLLTGDERTCFENLSIFAGSFTLAAASAVGSGGASDEIAILDLLSSLVDKSLVQSEPAGNGTRYRLLESMRQYARERLTKHGSYTTVARAHATAFLALAEELEHLYQATPDRAWDAQVEPEMDNWRAALEWTLIGRADLGLGQRLAGSTRWMWAIFAPAEGQRWVRSAVETIDADTPEAVIARLDLAEAHLDGWMHRYKESFDAAERALSRFNRLGDTRGATEAGWRAGNALVILGRIPEGETLLRDALEAAERHGLQKLTCWLLISLAHARACNDDAAGARSRYAEALTIAKAIHFERMTATIALQLSEMEFRSGDTPAALRQVGEALEGDRARHDTRDVAYDLCDMAVYLIALGKYTEALSRAREALTLSREIQADVMIAFALQHCAAIAALRPLADTEQDAGDRTRAARLLGYIDARLTALKAVREYTEQQEYDNVLAVLRPELGADDLAKLMDEGRVWTEDRAVVEALHEP